MSLFDIDLIPVLKSDRLMLRGMQAKERSDMYEYSKDPGVTKYLLWSEHPNEAYTRRYLKHVERRYKKEIYYDWAIIYNGDGPSELDAYKGRMIGTCGFASIDFDNLCGEIGYVLNPEYWGRGIAVEALEKVIEFGFENLGLHRIEARFMEGNDSSRRVMEKVGMTFEGIQREAMLIKGSYANVGVCAILAGEWRAKKGRK